MSVQESVPGAVLEGAVLAPRRASAAVAAPAAAPARDLRVDLLRGLAIVIVVVNHTHLSSLLLYATQERVGVVTGAELFVALSGFVLGMIHRRRVAAGGARTSALILWRRAQALPRDARARDGDLAGADRGRRHERRELVARRGIRAHV